jgi:hypothetical protein
MPLRFSTLYRKTKCPVEISLILGLGEGIFAILLFPRQRRGWGGSVSVIPPKAEYQNRKIFFSLIEKIGGAIKKM